MKKLLLKSMLLLCALVVGSMNGWATDVLYYTLDGTTTGGTNGYATESDITQNGISWKATGNTTSNPWRIGGKSTDNVDRPVYSVTGMGAVISKVEFNFGATISTQLTINSVTLTVSTGSNGTGTVIDEVVKTSGFSANGTLTFNPSAGKEWSKNSFYKLTFNIKTADTSNNYYLQFKNAKFYTQSYVITAASNNNSYGTVSLEGFTITATPKSGYRVISGTGGYTVSSGTATVTNNGDNTFTVAPTSNCTITINFEAIPSHTATFSINGVEDSDDYLEGEDIVFPSNPSIGGLAFMGWVTAPIVGTTDDAPASYETSGVMSTADVTYYAVFATQGTGEGNITLTITKDTENFPTSYGTAKTFTEYTLEGKKFKIQQSYINSSSKLQWRSGTDTSNGAGTLYNTEALYKIQSIELTYNGDSNKNFTVSVGDAENPTSGTSIDATGTGNVRTYDCSSYNKSYFVLTNGDYAGYLDAIAITYRGTTTLYSAYRTSISTINASVTSAQYATFCDEIARDFSASGITVYAATASATSVAFDEVTDGVVPANTGVVLYSASVLNDVAIPATTKTATYDFSANEMVGVNSQTTIALDGGSGKTNYILANGGSGVGFYKAAVGGAKLAAHKAYLSTATASASRDFLGFNEETTGVNEVKTQKVDGEYYNLAGQRVAQPTKGLYIVNGKKVIMK